MTIEERLDRLEGEVAALQEIVLAPLPYSLEDQHRMKLAARALASVGKAKETR